MHKLKFLYIDDERDDAIRPFSEGLEETSTELAIEPLPPKPFKEQLLALAKTKMDGLILDLRLDEHAVDGSTVGYRGIALAQEIRTRATEGTILPFPIILWSSEQKLQKSYIHDPTAQELIDWSHLKSQVAAEPRVVANELISLARGYALMSKAQKLGAPYEKCLGVGRAQAALLDNRIARDMFPEWPKLPIHNYAHLILHQLIGISGPLLSESVLAARLGVDPEKSRDWGKLLSIISRACKYDGVFGDGWSRWWWIGLADWWRRMFPDAPLRKLTAGNRVAILQKKTRLRGLTAAEPIVPGYSTCFWSVCAGLNKPLDPMDGLLVASRSEYHPWQDRLYISSKAAIERVGISEGIRVSTEEEGRLNALREGAK